MDALGLLNPGKTAAGALGRHDSMAAWGPHRKEPGQQLVAHGALHAPPPRAAEAAGVGGTGARPAPARRASPGHELVQLLLVLLVLAGDGVLGLLLHGLHEVLHVLEGIDLEQDTGTGSCLVWGPASGARHSCPSNGRVSRPPLPGGHPGAVTKGLPRPGEQGVMPGGG